MPSSIPAITLLNAARIENDQGRFEFYMDGISPRVAGVLEAVDRERKAVAALLGVEVQSLVEWLASAYRATGSDLFEAVRANEGYRGITAPSTLEHRYILEDVPMSLVPIASAGRAFGLKSQAIEALILLAGLIMDTNYWTRGRTLESLGLAGLEPGRDPPHRRHGELRWGRDAWSSAPPWATASTPPGCSTSWPPPAVPATAPSSWARRSRWPGWWRPPPPGAPNCSPCRTA